MKAHLIKLIFSILVLATMLGIQACQEREAPEKDIIEYSGRE